VPRAAKRFERRWGPRIRDRRGVVVVDVDIRCLYKMCDDGDMGPALLDGGREIASQL
jgi:hypothetical protein